MVITGPEGIPQPYTSTDPELGRREENEAADMTGESSVLVTSRK